MSPNNIRIGIDFDNTIVKYDDIFHKVAFEAGHIPPGFPKSKKKIRDSLRNQDREGIWTEMQGYVYGPGMDEAVPFPGVFDFFQYCNKREISLFIVSHKTLFPYAGPRYDLHQSAFKWLEDHKCLQSDVTGMDRSHVFFELSLSEKIERIRKLGCTHFIDDLPELFSEFSFPKNITCILFSPEKNHTGNLNVSCMENWDHIYSLL